MFLWLYGLTFSLTLYFIAENEPLGIQLTPLLITTILSFLVTLRNLREKTNASLHMASLATNVLLLLLLWTSPDSMYIIFASAELCIAIIYVVANGNIFFFTPPKWLAVANSVTLVLSTVLFVLMYAAVKEHTSNTVIFIPLTLLVLIEGYVVIRIETLQDLLPDKKKQLRNERLTYDITILVLLGTSIAYVSDNISLPAAALTNTLVYAAGLAYTGGSVALEVLRRGSIPTPSFQQLRGNDIDGV